MRRLAGHKPWTFFHLLLVLAPVQALGDDISCTVSGEVYVGKGPSESLGQLERGTSFQGQQFSITPDSGAISGSELFANSSQVVTVFLSESDNEETLDVMSRNERGELKYLSVRTHGDLISFSYFFGWLEMLLTGDCRMP